MKYYKDLHLFLNNVPGLVTSVVDESFEAIRVNSLLQYKNNVQSTIDSQHSPRLGTEVNIGECLNSDALNQCEFAPIPQLGIVTVKRETAQL